MATSKKEGGEGPGRSRQGRTAQPRSAGEPLTVSGPEAARESGSPRQDPEHPATNLGNVSGLHHDPRIAGPSASEEEALDALSEEDHRRARKEAEGAFSQSGPKQRR